MLDPVTGFGGHTSPGMRLSVEMPSQGTVVVLGISTIGLVENYAWLHPLGY